MTGTTKRKEFQDLEFQDSFMFAAVMEDEELCRQTLERILGFPIQKVVVRSEMNLLVNPDYHGIRMDVYAKDEAGTVFDVEMQTTREPADVLPKRTRFYQGQMDMALLKPGESYRKLPESYVIFICTFDPFGKQLYRYVFREWCRESGEYLEDGSTKIILNCDGKNDAEEPKELVDFLRYVKQSSTLRRESDTTLKEDVLLAGLESRVKVLKKNRGLEDRYMLFEEMLERERSEGREEGFSEGHAAGLSEGLKAGLTEGLKAGRAEGLEAGQRRMLALMTAMAAAGKSEEFPRLGEPEFLEEMLKQYQID